MSEAPHRVQLKRTKGWRMPPNTVKVDRTTRWGNPFNFKSPEYYWTAIACGERGDQAGRHAASVNAFRKWIQGGLILLPGGGVQLADKDNELPVALWPDVITPKPPTIGQIQRELRGKNLACWCRPDQPCHADVLLALANL